MFICSCPSFPTPLVKETLFSTMAYPCLLCYILIDHSCVGLFLGSPFCCIDPYVCFWERFTFSVQFSCVRLFASPWTIHSMEFSRPEDWSGWPFPSPGDLPNPEIKSRFPTLQVDSLAADPQGKPHSLFIHDLWTRPVYVTWGATETWTHKESLSSHVQTLFSPALLRWNWHIILYKFKVYTQLIRYIYMLKNDYHHNIS